MQPCPKYSLLFVTSQLYNMCNYKNMLSEIIFS